ncbi:MAG: 3-deoxy-8-phosphooctulonate synthase [Kiritimatiellae bacterium]|jgi:2-dehydro-3-deoxyphosphooctonate aldolase (KDO 8-P synthase)|nr:3-deoxy-8-phosphooctulonate synthase [Kiritimatiellia bacterium]
MIKTKVVSTGGEFAVKAGGKNPLLLMAGPCVIESREKCFKLAEKLKKFAEKNNVSYIFKASFDKANRSSVDAFRGPGILDGLEILGEIRNTFGMPVVTDIHEPWQAELAAKYVDVLQIPAFLCRQTDLLIAAGETGCVVNVKKMQCLAAEDMSQVIKKLESTGNKRIMLTERGESFGYRNLVADMRNLMILKEFGYPVIFDATHSVQRPGALGTGSGGDGKWAPALARAAVATGACDGVFIETYENPAEALSDGANALAFKALPELWSQLIAIDSIAKGR